MESVGFNEQPSAGFSGPVEEEKLKWNEQAAQEQAAKQSVADPNLSPAESEKMVQDLTTVGGSTTLDESNSALIQEQQQNMIEQASLVALDFGGEPVLDILKYRMKADPIQTVNERANETLIAGNEEYTPESEWERALLVLDKERDIDARIQEEMRDIAKFDGSLAGDFLEFITGAIPFRQSVESLSIGKMLEEKYGLDSPSAFESFLANGEYLNDLREQLMSLPSHLQLEAIRSIKETAKEATDWGLGPNDFTRLGMLDQLLQSYDANSNIDDIDIARGLNDAISVLDMTVLGKFAKNVFTGLRTSRTVLGGASEGSNASKVLRLNPEMGTQAHGVALADDTGSAAAKLGTSREDLIMDDFFHKFDEAGYGNKVSEDVLLQSRETAKKINQRRHDLAVDLSDLEKTAQAEKTAQRLNNLKGFNFRGNSSSIRSTDEMITVQARFGKTGTKGFESLDEINDAVVRMQRLYPEANITTDVITHEGRIKTVVAKEAIRSEDDILTQLKQELRVEAEGAVKRADTTGNKALRGNLKNAQFDISKAEKMIKYLRGEKGARNVPRALKDEAEALVAQHQAAGEKRLRATSVKQVVKDLQAQKLEAEKVANLAVSTEKAAKAGSVAKSELSRLEQGQPLKSQEWKRRLRDLQKENIRKVTREEAVSDPTNEYFLNMSFNKAFDTTEAAMSLDEIYVGGKYAHYLADISSGLSKRLSQTMIRGFDEAQGIEKMMSEALEPFLKANHESKKFILSMVKSGDEQGRAWSANELINSMPSSFSQKQMQQAIDGYYAFRVASDMVYNIKNSKYRSVLQQDGFLHVKAGDIDTIAKPLAGAERPAQVFDPVTGSMRSTADVEAEGLQIYKTRNRFKTGENNYANHIAVRTDDTISALPDRVLSYREGYVPRIYDEQYFVTVKNPNAFVNGVKVEKGKAVTEQTFAAKSAKEAQRLVNELARENPGMTVDYRNSRELTYGERVAADFNVERSTGGLFYSKRGEHVRTAADELADVANPVEAMQRMITSSARELTLDPVMELMRKRWLSQFGDLTNGRYPTSHALITSEKLADPVVSKAKAMWNYIENAQNGAVTTREWRANMVRLGEWVESKGFDSLGKAIRTSERDPFSYIRGMTHMFTIVANPLRQIFIQAQGVLLNAGVDGFAGAMAKAHQAPILLMATAIGKSKREFAQRMITKFGLDQDKEFMAMVRGLDESGLIQAIDSHLLTRDALRHVDDSISASNIGRGMSAARNALVATTGTVRRYGFDLGEQMNITMTYAVAFNRMKVQKGIKGVFQPTKQELAEIAADARQMALTMNTPGALGYQKGVLSLATQFLAVQHKAWLAGMRGVPGLSKYGNKVYTVKEGRRILLGQTLLYGATGWGLSELLDKGMKEFGVEMSPEAREKFHGGVYDWVMNSLLEATTGEDTNVAFSENIAAGGGFQRAITALFLDPVTDEVSLPDLFLGPSTNMFSKIGSLMSISRSIIGSQLQGNDLTEVEMKMFTHDAARMLSGYNNWFKGQVIKNVGTWVNKNGQIIDRSLVATPTEAALYTWLGLSDTEVKNYYSSVNTIKETKEGLKQTAKEFVDRVEQVMAHYDKIGTDYGYMAELDTALKLENVMLSILDPQDREAVMALVVKELKYRGVENTIAEQLNKAAISGSLGSDLPKIADDLLRKGLIEPEDHRRVMQYISSEFE